MLGCKHDGFYIFTSRNDVFENKTVNTKLQGTTGDRLRERERERERGKGYEEE